jgi:hypothetical protein
MGAIEGFDTEGVVFDLLDEMSGRRREVNAACAALCEGVLQSP